jgi:hypothetical protein
MQFDAVLSRPVSNPNPEHGSPPAALRVVFGEDGPPAVTREMAQARAREIALSAGRPVPHVTQLDYEQAKRELTGEADFERQNAVFEAARL